MAEARALRERARGPLVTYSPKVFVPLTKLCRDVCHYCTFAHPPRRGERAYMTIDEVLEVARAGERAGCREALFTLGDKPELRYRAARDELAALGCETTVEYLALAARAVLEETSLLPHLNPGVLTAADFDLLRPVAALDGADARDAVRSAVGAGRPALRLARQAPRSAARDAAPCGRGARAVHDRDPDRDRRDAGRAARRAARDRRGGAARPGGDRPELPRQARHAHGRRARAAARGAALDDRGGAPDPPAGGRRAGAAEPDRATSRGCSTPASTTGAASRRSRSTTSTRRRRGPSSSCCAPRPRAAGSSWRRA